MRQNNTRLYVIFISLCFGLCLGLIVSEPHISPYKDLSLIVCWWDNLSLWFSKELKNYLSKTNWLHGVILILLVCESIFVGWGFPFPVVLVPRYKLSLCHSLIKPDLLAFSRIGVFAWPRDHEVRINLL